jgi:DnaK suppressor protein
MTVQKIITEAELLAMPDDQYMNAQQLDFFRRLLQQQLEEVTTHLSELRQAITQPPDVGDDSDKASLEEEKALLRQADRDGRMVDKLIKALERLEQDDFGYCKETGDRIGLARLLLRPTAELSMEAKQLQEQKEEQFARTRGSF